MHGTSNTWKQRLTVLAAGSLLGISSLAFAHEVHGAQGGQGMMGQGGHMMGPGMMGQGSMCTGQMPCHMGNALTASDQQLHSMQETGNADRDFARMMIVHHQGAIDMAKAELKNGKAPEMHRMAQQIIESQQKEIDKFNKWLGKQPADAAQR